MNTNSSRPDCVFCEKELTISVLKNILKNGRSYDIYECDKCEIATLHPFPSEEELSKLYSCGNYRTGAGKRFFSFSGLAIKISCGSFVEAFSRSQEVDL